MSRDDVEKVKQIVERYIENLRKLEMHEEADRVQQELDRAMKHFEEGLIK